MVATAVLAPSDITTFSEVYNVKNYLAKGDGSTDDTAALNAALTAVAGAGGGRIFIPRGRYIISSPLLIGDNTLINGEGACAEIYLASSSNCHCLTNINGSSGNSSVTITNIKVNGNKAGQSSTASARGIYLQNTADVLIDGVLVDGTIEHGIHLSTSLTVYGARIANCLSRNIGAGGGKSSSGFATSGGKGVTFVNCHSRDNERAGFRIDSSESVLVSNCYASGNGDGGFIPVSGSHAAKFTNCIAYANGIWNGTFNDIGDGFRLTGQQEVHIIDCHSEGNAASGIMLYNGCKNILVKGCTLKNNGQYSSAPTSAAGRSGVTLRNSGSANTKIDIEGSIFFDDQGSPTQAYGIQLEDGADEISVKGNRFYGHASGSYKNNATGTAIQVDRQNVGLSLSARSSTTVTLTGSTTETDLVSQTTKAYELGRLSGIRLFLAGSCSGTANIKQLKFYWAGSSISTIISQSAATQEVFTIEAEIWTNGTGTQKISIRRQQGTSSFNTIVTTASASIASDNIVKITGILADGADTINIRYYNIEPIY